MRRVIEHQATATHTDVAVNRSTSFDTTARACGANAQQKRRRETPARPQLLNKTCNIRSIARIVHFFATTSAERLLEFGKAGMTASAGHGLMPV